MDARSVFVEAAALEWRETAYPGIEWKKLRFDPEGGSSAVLLHFEAGAAYGAHRHPAGEEYYVLEGELEDGGNRYGAGSYVYHPPGSSHRPSSPSGCLIFVCLPESIQIVE